MKKIINRKVYNTETAKELASYWNGLSRQDFGYIYEDLYKTRNGAYFLHVEGGASTIYSESGPNGWRSAGETIKPLDSNELYEWLERRNESDLIEEIFNDIQEA